MSPSDPQDNGHATGRPQLRQPRLAEMVASILRERIISGALRDGALLPKQDELLDEFRVSRPSLREALRILETEGLVTVRRGNVGGAVVQAPSPESSAYMFGMVLQSRHVPMTDLANALRHIEPAAAALCAEREDREREVVPLLRAALQEAEEGIKDGVRFTDLARRFHEEMVAACGNRTMILLTGALEMLWSEQEHQWAERAEEGGVYPQMRDRRAVQTVHRKILDCIERGDADRAALYARKHLQESQRYALAEAGDRVVRGTSLRGALR